MNGKLGLVSIVIPCYNSEGFIRVLLDSILDQDYSSIEVIAVDDGSSDSTLSILRSYEVKFRDRDIEFVIITRPNGGVASAINEGLRVFKGDYVTFIDSDDYLSDKASLSKRVDLLEKNDKIVAAFCKADLRKESSEGEVISTLGGPEMTVDIFSKMLNDSGYVWPPVVYLVRSSSLKSVNPKLYISEFESGQNIQLFLPLWYESEVGYVDTGLVTVVAREDSHSRRDRGDDDIYRQREIEKIYIETIKALDIPVIKKDKFLNIVKNRFKDKTAKVIRNVIDDREESFRLYNRDRERFANAYFKGGDIADQVQLASRLTFSAHSLEKSLSNDGFEIGHGFSTAKTLVDLLSAYVSKSYDIEDMAYINTISVLKEFYDAHRGSEFQEEIETILGFFLEQIDSSASSIGGSIILDRDEKYRNSEKNFEELSQGRYSIRSYSDMPVKKEEIKRALDIAMKAPSACNRQPVRARVMYDKDVISEVLKVQGGIDYYDTPPVLILLTADDRNYIDFNERNQGYIDGGLFAMSLLYSLEFIGLASCPLHAMFETERDLKIRGMLDIPDNEKFITFISVGNYPSEIKSCKSFRYDSSYITQEVDSLSNYIIEDIYNRDIDRFNAPDDLPYDQTVVSKSSIISKIRVKLSLRSRIRIIYGIVRGFAVKSFDSVESAKNTRRLRKADGAIVTLTGYYNYGNIIQRYALQKFLKYNGYSFVSYVDDNMVNNPIYKSDDLYIKTTLVIRAIKRFIRNQRPYFHIPSFAELHPEAKNNVNLINFVNKNIWIKTPEKDDKFNNYIVGSDQVWRNWWGDVKKFGYYFLDFLGDRETNRVSYAASFGMNSLDEVMSDDDVLYVGTYLKKFNHISIREESGLSILSEIFNIDDADVVLDPTLLLDAEDYSELIDKSEVREESVEEIFSYVIGETDEVREFVDKVKDTLGYGLTKITAHNETDDQVLPHLELWLKGYRDSKLVVTNSFHGMMFCIINNTDFIIIGREVGGLSRIEDFLERYNISGRLVLESNLDSFDIKDMKDIDWELVNRKIAKDKVRSSEWLLSRIVCKNNTDKDSCVK